MRKCLVEGVLDITISFDIGQAMPNDRQCHGLIVNTGAQGCFIQSPGSNEFRKSAVTLGVFNRCQHDFYLSCHRTYIPLVTSGPSESLQPRSQSLLRSCPSRRNRLPACQVHPYVTGSRMTVWVRRRSMDLWQPCKVHRPQPCSVLQTEASREDKLWPMSVPWTCAVGATK